MTLLGSLGLSRLADALAQILTVPPYAVAAIVLCLGSHASDRLQIRGLFVAGSCLLSAIGYMYVAPRSRFIYDLNYFSLLLTVGSNIHVRYFATFCVTTGIYSTISGVLTWCEYLSCTP